MAKNDPFSLTFRQIVALMLLQRSVDAGRLDERLLPGCFLLCDLKISLSREEERVVQQE